MNFSYSLARTRFLNGAAKVRIFFESARLSGKIFKKIFRGGSSCVSLVKNSGPAQPPVFQMGVQRYDFFHHFQIYFDAHDNKNTAVNTQLAEIHGRRHLLQFC